MNLRQDLSLEKKSLRDKFLVAFSLMSIIPLLMLVYFVATYVTDVAENPVQVVILVSLTLLLVGGGFFLIKQILDPIFELAAKTKTIADGRYGTVISMDTGDEITDIARSVNMMSGKIRSDLVELQQFGRKTAELNREVHRKVTALADLMRMGDIITGGGSFAQITSFAADKLIDVMDKSFSAIFMKEKRGKYITRNFVNNSGREVSAIELEALLNSLERVFEEKEYLALEQGAPSESWQDEVREKLGIENMLIIPLRLRLEYIGAVVLGSFEDGQTFTQDNIKIALAFSQELVLGYQNSRLYEKVKSVEVIDNITGLYTQAYLEDRLEDEINRSMFYQRPCSLIMMYLDGFDKFESAHGAFKSDLLLKQVSDVLSGSLPAIDKIAHFEGGSFGILLPEKNKREAIEFAGGVLDQIRGMEVAEAPEGKVTASMGIGENPIDGVNAGDVLAKAAQNLDKAKEQGGNLVVGD